MSPEIPGRATVAVSSDIAHPPRDHDRQLQRTAGMPADAAPERPARLSKAHPEYARTYTLLDQILPGRAITLPARPAFRKAPSIVARKRHFIEQFQADLGQAGLRNKNTPLFLTLKSVAFLGLRADVGRFSIADRDLRGVLDIQLLMWINAKRTTWGCSFPWQGSSGPREI